MAKSKSFFGLRSGSTKTLTFQVNQGRQVTKDRVYDVKNPRTISQMEGRCLMATTSAAYAHMKEIVDHSFEGITYGQNNMSEFIRRNYALLKAAENAKTQAFGYNAYRDRALYGGKYQISAGTAPSVFQNASMEAAGGSTGTSCQCVIPAGGTTSSVTVAQFCQANGLVNGDMATFICLYPLADGNGCGFAFIRLTVLDADNTATLSAGLQTAFKVESNKGTPTLSASGNNVSMFVVATDGAKDDSTTSAGCAIIRSRKAANGWLRSTEYLALESHKNLGPTFAAAVATFPIGGSYVLNGGAIK